MWPTFLHGPRRSGHPTARARTPLGGASYRPRLDLLEARLPLGDTLGGLLAWWGWLPDLPRPDHDLALTAHPGADVPVRRRAATERPASPRAEVPWELPATNAFAALESHALPPPGETEFANPARVGAWGDGAVSRDTAGGLTQHPPWHEADAAPRHGLPPLVVLAQFAAATPPEGAVAARTARKAPGTVDLSLFAGLPLDAPPVLPDSQTPPAAEASTEKQVREAYDRLPLSFEANLGQTDPEVRFLARGGSYTVYLTGREAVMQFHAPAVSEAAAETGAVVRLQLVGGNPAPAVQGREELPGKVNYYLGNDPSKWLSNVSTFGRVEYDEVYPGIDQVYYDNRGQLEYDFLVAPGADPGVIGLAFAGVSGLEIDPQGDLVLETAVGAVRQHKPFVYQEAASVRHEVASSYVLLGPGQVGFRLGAYDVARPLVIDPTLVYSRYAGGPGQDSGLGVAVDSTSPMFGGPFAYVTGSTQGLLTKSGDEFFYGALGGPSDAFVRKFHGTTGTLVFTTYLGGSGLDNGVDIDVEQHGWFIDVGGETDSADFPTWTAGGPCTALQCAHGGGFDAFVVMLDWDGTNNYNHMGPGFPGRASYSTYLGGSGADRGAGIATQLPPTHSPPFFTGIPPQRQGTRPRAPDPFVPVTTDSPDAIPTSPPPYHPTPFQSIYGGGLFDVFVARIGPTPSFPSWIYATYLGGSADDYAQGIAVDVADNAYVTGKTSEPVTTRFPTMGPPPAGPFQSDYAGGAYDAFVTKIAPTGESLVYSSYLGGSGWDEGLAINVPWLDMGSPPPVAYVTGWTDSEFDFLGTTPGTYGGGSSDAFVTRVNPLGTALLSSVFAGGTGDDVGSGIDVAGTGPYSGVYAVTGFTTSAAGFVLLDPLPCCTSLRGGMDAFVRVYSPLLGLAFSTYLGGTGLDIGLGIAVYDTTFNVYVAGVTNSPDFPGAPPGTYGGGFDAFLCSGTP